MFVVLKDNVNLDSREPLGTTQLCSVLEGRY